jgi:predicted  nucleic acid-binding Zn-ribbon protein
VLVYESLFHSSERKFASLLGIMKIKDNEIANLREELNELKGDQEGFCDDLQELRDEIKKLKEQH